MFRFVALLLCVPSLLGVLSAQTVNGTVTGVVTDPTGAVVANAAIEVKNTETGVVFRAVSTDTGNYTVAQLPVGSYEVGVTVQGFKKYNRQGLTLSAAQVLRLDSASGSRLEHGSCHGQRRIVAPEDRDLRAVPQRHHPPAR